MTSSPIPKSRSHHHLPSFSSPQLSSQFLTNISTPRQLKFNGSRRFIKPCQTNISSQSIYNPPKTSIKCNSTYTDNIKNPNPEDQKFLQTRRKIEERPRDYVQHPRGYGDFGATKNRLKIVERKEDSDPITQEKVINKLSTLSVWQEDRRQRDNGVLCKSTLEWQPERKGGSYLTMYKSRCKN